MEIKYKIDSIEGFSKEEKEIFKKLLIEQGQVSSPTIGKINKCSFLCLAYFDNEPIGIGAIKQVYKSPFDYANINKEIKDLFDCEIGYLYVKNDKRYRGLGIGKSITKLLLSKVNNENVFATTELSKTNVMLHILTSLGFSQFGSPYKGKETKKVIVLMLKFK